MITATIRQFCIVPNTGHVVVLYSDGTIRRQRPSDIANKPEWELVDTADLSSGVVAIGVDFSGRVTVQLRDGSLHREVPPSMGTWAASKRANAWKPIEGPKE